ncbi:MAG: helix-turn-helix domain-containing protein [Chloroflexi bacterium]|nr:helix-turn-helix domain-containing protein [Chloroflexota bacterium]MBM3173688.1 helix-turn-helix domain-containing protein [Chloroflexota bacterium]MBM3174788.1 helix-turn-helix domain-containing protein [Chloroflexota bacterium]MBM4450226.1 helix-turn-helix domain-containing protein [Chloroflexota bacterium]
MASQSEERLITVREAAAEYGKNMETVRRWIWSGKLPAQKLGNQLFIKRSDLRALHRKRQSERQKVSLLEFLEEARALREEIRKHAGNFDVTELIRESREDLL